MPIFDPNVFSTDIIDGTSNLAVRLGPYPIETLYAVDGEDVSTDLTANAALLTNGTYNQAAPVQFHENDVIEIRFNYAEPVTVNRALIATTGINYQVQATYKTFQFQYWNGMAWVTIRNDCAFPVKNRGGWQGSYGTCQFYFDPITASQFRLVHNPDSPFLQPFAFLPQVNPYFMPVTQIALYNHDGIDGLALVSGTDGAAKFKDISVRKITGTDFSAAIEFDYVYDFYRPNPVSAGNPDGVPNYRPSRGGRLSGSWLIDSLNTPGSIRSGSLVTVGEVYFTQNPNANATGDFNCAHSDIPVFAQSNVSTNAYKFWANADKSVNYGRVGFDNSQNIIDGPYISCEMPVQSGTPKHATLYFTDWDALMQVNTARSLIPRQSEFLSIETFDGSANLPVQDYNRFKIVATSDVNLTANLDPNAGILQGGCVWLEQDDTGGHTVNMPPNWIKSDYSDTTAMETSPNAISLIYYDYFHVDQNIPENSKAVYWLKTGEKLKKFMEVSGSYSILLDSSGTGWTSDDTVFHLTETVTFEITSPFTPSYGVTPYTYEVTGPSWLAIDSSTGTLSGTPPTGASLEAGPTPDGSSAITGEYWFRVRVKDATNTYFYDQWFNIAVAIPFVETHVASLLWNGYEGIRSFDGMLPRLHDTDLSTMVWWNEWSSGNNFTVWPGDELYISMEAGYVADSISITMGISADGPAHMILERWDGTDWLAVGTAQDVPESDLSDFPNVWTTLTWTISDNTNATAYVPDGDLGNAYGIFGDTGVPAVTPAGASYRLRHDPEQTPPTSGYGSIRFTEITTTFSTV